MKKLFCIIVVMMLGVAMFAQNQLLPNLVYSKEPAVVKGEIIGIPASMESVNIVMTPSWTTDEIVQTVALDKNGKFETKFNACVTSMAAIRLGVRNEKRFYITPGQEVRVTVDMSNDMVTCEGPLAELNNSLANYYDEFREQNLNAEINGQGISKLRGFTVTQYRDKMMELYNKAVKRLNDDTRLSPEFREYMMPHYQFLTFALMTGYDRILKYANNGQGEYTKPDDYYDPVKVGHFFFIGFGFGLHSDGDYRFGEGNAFEHDRMIGGTNGLPHAGVFNSHRSSNFTRRKLFYFFAFIGHHTHHTAKAFRGIFTREVNCIPGFNRTGINTEEA